MSDYNSASMACKTTSFSYTLSSRNTIDGSELLKLSANLIRHWASSRRDVQVVTVVASSDPLDPPKIGLPRHFSISFFSIFPRTRSVGSETSQLN